MFLCTDALGKEVSVIFLAGVDDMDESFFLVYDDEDMMGKTLYTNETNSLITSVSIPSASVAHINSSAVNFFEKDGKIVFYYVISTNVADDATNLYLAIITDTGCQTGQYVLDLELSNAYKDADGDGLTDYVEVLKTWTDPNETDSDFDGFSDGEEIADGNDPFTPNSSGDTDGDGLLDTFEISIGTSPLLADTDGDGTNDLMQYAQERRLDTDGDGLIDVADPDDDNDGISDANEIVAGTDTKFNPNYWYVDAIAVNGTTYYTRTDLYYKTPVVVSLVPDGSNGLIEDGEIFFSDANHKVVMIVGDLGNLDGEDGNEVAFLVRDNNTNLESKIIIDIQSGKVYQSGTTTEETASDSNTSEEATENSYCDIDFVSMDVLSDGKLVVVGFCTETNQAVVQTLSKTDNAYTIIKEENVLNAGIAPLTIEVKDVNGDGSEDIVVTPKSSGEKRIMQTVSGITITITPAE